MPTKASRAQGQVQWCGGKTKVIRHKEHLDAKKIKLLGFISFLMGFSQAVSIYVLSSYFKLASGTENIGPFYFVSFSVVLIALLNFHKIVRKSREFNVFYISFFLTIVTIVFLMLTPPSYLTVVFLMLYLVLMSLSMVSLDIILESFSSDKASGRVRGIYLTMLNAGFLIGPLLSVKTLERFGFDGVFLISFLLNSFTLFLALFTIKNVKISFNKNLKVAELLEKVYRRKDIRSIYCVSFALEFFYALMVVYTPIYLLDLGLPWGKIGIIFTFMLVPFVFLQYPVGILADKKWGEKELVIVSLVLMGLSTGVIYFIGSKSIFIWSVVLFSTRIGSAMIEVLRDSYFYKRIDRRDVDIINFFRTAMPMGYILSAALSVFVLSLFSTKAVFILAASVVFLALWPALKLADNKAEGEGRG